ncbi:titin-like isoform X3 [Actinia tenebrosa]|uniref:Titin-like isoform X3 n=1 Tax=Actinia tenebrosa TaxID=6105 RepID=A0A6P8I510_ACTTE|nr:titin-like isoform X3 [Actinia tenebrosa]
MDKSDLVKFRSECISAHNFYRSLHGTTPLVWSTRLADGAQKWAEQLASADSLTYSQERGIGENIACLWGSNVTGNKVTQIWYEESQNYDYSAPRVTPNNRPFCQVVWEGTRELGAGKASTKNGKQVVVARYHPPASRKQVEKNVKSPKIDGSTALTTRTSVGLRKFQEECLFAHNEFRVLHGAPPLHWSPSLAWAAQQWAEELAEIGELKHNNDEMVGENLAGMVGDELTGKECTDMWYEEVNEFNFENPCYSEETSNFTQVVWIGSELLGVGRAKIADTCIVVAFYEPPGNIEGSFGANVRLQGTKVKTYRLTKEMKTFIPPSPDLEWFRIECLVAHNYFRARHGAPPLVIGQALNEEAQYWAERLLVTGATEDLQDSRIGINVAVIHGHHVSGLKVTELWYDEGTGYNFESPGFSLSTRSFTQLIWLTSRKLGIGKATNNSGQCVIVARYEPVGNIDGLFVANVRRRGDERNGLEPMIFESDVKYRFKVEGRRSFRMSWEVEGTQTLQAVDKTRDKTRRKEQAQPAYLSSPETFTRLVWIESPVLPRKQMRESCDLDMEKSDDDKESGVEEVEEFEQEGTEPEPEEGRVLSRVAYFEHFERIEKDKLDRPKRSSIEVTEQVRHEQFQDEEAKSHKLSEHEEAVRQLEYDDVFPKHDENDERDDDFASEGEAEDDDDDVMSLETVSEAEEDLLEELDEYEMDHHIKSYCYEVNYPREEDEMNINNDETTDERGQIADIIETELDRMDKEQDSLDPDHFVASSADRDGRAKNEMRVVDTHIEFVPIQVVKRRKDFNPDDVIFDETEEDKELFKYEIKTPEKEKPARPLCTESVSSQTRDRVECELNFDEMFSRMDKTEKPKGKPPPTLPKPKRKLKEEAPTEPRTDIIRTLETKQIVDTVHRIKTEPEPVTVQKEEIVETSKHVTEEKTAEPKLVETPSESRAEMIRTLETKRTVESVHRLKTEPEPTVQKEEIVETSKHVTEEKPAESKPLDAPSQSRAEMIRTLETKQTVESVHRIKTEPEPTVQKEEIVESSKHVTDEKPAEPKLVGAESKEQLEEAPCSDEETFESFDVSFIDRKRKLKNIFKRLGRRIELIPTTETITTPREFDRNTDLSETKEEEELFRVYDAPIVDRTTRNKNPVQEETILAEYRKRDVESEIDFEEMFERLEKGEETPSKEPVLELTQDLVVLESERAEEEPQEEKARVVRFDKTVIFQEHESVHKEFVELREEGAASEEYEDVEAESALDFEDHCEEFEEVDEARTEEREQITPASPVHLAHECEEPSELFADTSDQEEEEVESYGEEEEVRTSVSPMDEEETSVQFSEELSERSNSYGNCEVDTIEPRNSVAEVYEEYEPTPVSVISEMSSSRPIHVAADIDNQPLKSGVEEKSVRTTMYESFEEVLPDAFVSPVIEPSTCYIAAELNHHTTEVEPVEEVVEMAALSSDEEPETIEKIGVRGIPESTESTVCITTETTFHHRTEIVQKRAPSIEVEMPLEKEESIEEEPTYKEILPNGHCTSVYISHDIDGGKTEIITETESYETEIPQTLEEEKVAVSELQSDYEIPSNISVQSQRQQEENVEENVKEEEVEQLEEAEPVTANVEEMVERREEEKEEEIVEEEEKAERLEEVVPVTDEVEETVEEREDEKGEETVKEEEEEAEQLEEAVPVTDKVEETVEERKEEKEEEVEQLEEAVPITEDKEETDEEGEEEQEEETVKEEEEEEAKQLEEAVHVTEDVEETVEREEQKEEEIVKEEEEAEQLEEAVPVTQNVEEMVEEREEQKEDETVEEVKEHVTESKQEGDLEFPDGSEKSEEREQVEEAEKQQVVEIEKSQTLVVDDRFEYISEEELEETEELYEALRESFEEQDNEELIDEENVRVQQTAARIIHIDSQEEENYEAFGEEASEDEIVYDTEVITEVEKEITSALVVKESFSSAVCEDETANENVHPEERETESPVEETQAKTLLQFSEPADEDGTEEYVDEREPMDLHDDSDDVFMTEEQFEPSKTPDIEECEELESSDEIIDKEVELIQFTEETVEEEKVTSGDEEVFQEEKAVSESEERSPTPDEEDERDDLDSSEEFAEENIELIQFDEQVDEDKAIDEGSEVDELYPLSPDVIEEKQIVNESGVELIQFTEQVEEERVKDGERMESPELEHVESEGQQDDEQITDEKTEHIQFVEHTEEIESTHTGQAEEMLKEYVTKDSGKIEVEEELVISQPIACSTPIFLDEKEQSEDTTSFDDSAEAGYGEKYEDMENIVAHDHSLDVSQSISLEESSDLSNDFYKAEAEETASKAVAEEFDDSGRQETEPESLEEVEDEKEETSVTSSSVVTTTVYEKRIIKTEHTKREFVDFTPLETAEAMRHKESREEHLSPPPKITATEFVAAEEEEGSEEEYLPNFEHPRTYMIESKEVVMDRNAVESKFVEQEESAPLKELEKEEHEEPAVGIQAPSEMDTGIETEVIETEPQKVETRTTTVSVSHRSEVVRKQQSDIDDLEEKELEERIQRKQKAMEEKLLQDEIKEDIPDKRTNESEESRTEAIFTSISVVKVAHEDDEQRIFREEDATIKMSEDEEKLKEEESSTEEQDVKEDEALTEAAFRAEREEEERKAEDTSDEPDRGQREDEVAQVPIIPLMTASDVAYKTARSEKEIHEDYQEEVEVERIESKTHPVVLTDVDFTEEIEVEKMQEELEEEEDSGKQDVYEEEVEIQRVENQEEQFIEEYHDDVFEEEVMIERIEEEHKEEQESSPDAASLLVYEEELEVAADQIPEQPNPAEVNVVQAEPLHEDAGQNNDGQNNADENDAGEDNVGENNEVGQVEEEEQAWEEYEEMEEQDQEIPQEIQGIAVQGDMHLYDNNNNESLPRYYVDFSPGGSFEHESTTSDDGEGPEVYRQGEPMEEDMEEFILVKYEDQSSSSEEDISDHREMYVIHEEDSEDRADEKKEMTEESHEEKVAYDQGFVNPALEDIREEEEEEKQKHHQGEGEEVDIEEKLQLEEYERLESFVILEEKLSQVESDESIEDLTSGTDGKRASSEETLNDEDELSETRTSSTLKDGSNSKDDASGDEASTPETQPSALDTTLTKEVEEETIDLEDGGVLSKRTVREESYSIEEDDGDDDDKDKTLTRKKISKKVITTTSTSETHVKRIESKDNPSPSGSDNESEHQKEHAEDLTTKYTTETVQPEKQYSGDEKSGKEIDESPKYGTKMIETEQETIDLDDGGVMNKFVTREETYTVEEGNGDGHDDQDSSISRKTVSKKIVTTTTTSTSRVTRLEDEPSSFSDDDANRVVETSSEETHTTIIKSRQPEEPLVTAKRQLSLENYGASSEACKDPSRKRRGFLKRFDSHESEGHSSEVSSTTDSTGESTSISSEGHVSDEDFSGLDEFQIDCIRQHNIYRHRHRACRLLWSEDLAAAAAQWADHLAATKTLDHSPQKECGENLACAKGYDLRGDKVADMWYEEISDYNFEIPAFNAKCGHFTQMIWRGTKEFGVAKTIADDGSQYVVARYNPPGNILGEFKDSIRRSRGQKTNVRKRRRSSTRRQLSHSSDMSNVLHREKFKNECVISHNYYRSLHGAPPLKWSTMLANEAQTFAEKLTKSGSFMHSGSKEIGECLAFSFGLDLSGRDAVDTWYDEIVDYDYEYPGYTSHTANFTQVVWAGSKEFGMGKAIGDDGSCVVVGKYYPPGNIVGDFHENVKQKGTGF